jgi:mono/diheme cytochrome c family protein
MIRVFIATFAVLINIGPELRGDQPVDFNRDIRPVLANACYRCHGPDAAERKSDLRLDTEAGAKADLGGFAAIVPGNLDESELIARITSTDPMEVMPPPASGKSLKPEQVALITKWVAEGARFARHWSYERPTRRAPPEVSQPDWPKNQIDRFILSRLEAEALQPSPEADKASLARRVALDLTGLPPDPEEAAQFLQDERPNAYEIYVDRLLSNASYGEHWARLWLDLARYADSAGYADDPARTIWAYRDYVIRSFDANKPFDQFTIEQLAGDLLPNPSDEQLIATAFHRNTMTNNEGGTSDEEFRNVAIVDRVNTTASTWLGSSVACAQCHNHKYDPISQRDYFRLFAILNNCEDADRTNETPILEIWTPEQRKQESDWKDEAARLEASIQSADISLEQATWERDIPADLGWFTLKPDSMTSSAGKSLQLTDDGTVVVEPGAITDVSTVTVRFHEDRTIVALRIEARADPTLPANGPGLAANGNFVVTKVESLLDAGDGYKPIAIGEVIADFSQEKFDPPGVLKGENKPGQGWAVGGSTGQSHFLTLALSAPIEVKAGQTVSIRIEQNSESVGHVLGRFRIAASGAPRAIEVARIPTAVVKALSVKVEHREEACRKQIADYFRTITPGLKPSRDRLAEVRKGLAEQKPYTTVPIFRELQGEARRKTRIQLRGNWESLSDEVSPGLPEVLTEGASQTIDPDRLALARWLVSAENPLTARVVANRYWEQIFGIGLVRTSEEFGTQGELPTHPELLDWLATELIRSGWDMKSFLRTLVTSSTYRQSSRVSPELEERDPENRLLARGPRFRLSAEMVRDQALSIAGLLSKKRFGPPVNPPRPATGLTAAFGSAIDKATSQGEDRYRRALYIEWRRTNPYPSMTTFDAPNRDVCLVRRNRSNTPLQALVTLNDPVYVEASQALARRIIQEGGADDESRARFAIRACFIREASPAEVERITHLIKSSREDLSPKPDAAKKLATEPLGPLPDGIDTVEAASWTVVANVLLNLDEMFLKR